MRGGVNFRGGYLSAASLVIAFCIVLLASFCATKEVANETVSEEGGSNISVESLYQPSSCTHVIEQGELVTENQWVDCSFGVQSLNLTYDGEDTLFIVMEPDGAFSLCTRQPFGTVFDDDAVQMWIYTPVESMKEDLQLEITYSQRADTFAYSTGLLEDYDESFSSYSVEDLKNLDTYSYDKVSSLQANLREGNWSSINKDLNNIEEGKDESAGGHNHFPIYNRITLRNTNKKDTAALIIDSLVLVNNYTSQKLYVTSVKENTCELPYLRLPSPPEVEETFRSMLDVAEVEKQKSAIPLFAGIASALFLVAVGVAVLTIVIHTKKLRHLYIPFEDLEFDTPPEIIGRGKFGYVLRGSYNSFPVATKLVLPSNTAKGTMFESSFSSIGSESKGTVTYLEGNNEKSQAGSVEYMYTYGKETNAITMSRDRNSFDFYSTTSTEGTDISISSNDSLNSLSTKSLLAKKKWRQKRDFENEIRLLMKLRHPNIVTIMGVSKDSSTSDYVLVMERMSRGSLIDCLTNPTTHMDNELILGIMKDIAAGMAYLHNLRPAVVHNDLRAANILIDDNFTAKISDFGLSGRQRFVSSSSRWPWTAPEIFGGNLHSQKTDVYSFGVLLIEIFTRCKLTVSDMRLVVPKEAPSFAVSLIRQCLHANPHKRPTFAEIQEHILAEHNTLKKSASMIPARNIMFSHLPAKIAEDIKMGRNPSSTSYKCLTLLMSDIVGYTELTEKLGPESVTRLLNQFYTQLDDLVTKYHLYKIETIGDAYFAVGGMLEDENVDTNHCARVMAFSEEAIQAAKEICIPSDEENTSANIRIRIGIHSGPCVGAVVGSLNPKFSLYGDTVNVVSRVESTGKPDNIHVSSDAAELLRKQNIQMSSNLMYRGSTKLKGKGYMQTYWYKRDSGRSSLESPSESPSDCPSSPREYSLEHVSE